MTIYETLTIVFLFLSIESFILMYTDKRFAKKGKQRIPETAFTTLALVGGGIGILIGGLIFSHKTSKPSFMLKIGAAMIVNIIAVLFLASQLAA